MGVHKNRLFIQEIVSNEKAVEELLEYSRNRFLEEQKDVSTANEEELYIEAWQRYANEAKDKGVFETLQEYFHQLKFPIDKGISGSEEYRNATLRGRSVVSESRLQLRHPEWLQLEIYESDLIGKVPVIVAPDQQDFYTLICAFAHRNEPKDLPKSMGAVFINGLYNWDRIHQLKEHWLRQNPFGTSWPNYFKQEVLPNPSLFKDKLMILSAKDYSNVKSDRLHISEKDWKNASLAIRREHECAHLFTLKNYGCMNNNMHDELIADYAGIVKALGHLDKNWMLHFLGLEEYPKYRKGGRLENYQGNTKLSDAAFDGLKTLVKHAIDSIEQFDHSLGPISNSKDLMNRIISLCQVDLISMALPSGFDTLVTEHFKHTKSLYYEGEE